MTMAPTTAPSQATAETADAGHVDVLIVGAGVSGIGVAHHLRDQFPDRTFVILDAQDNRGGTWWTHRYPGVRSDSDLFTYGYRFKPWRGPSIAAGEAILDYLDEVIDEDDLAPHIRYRQRVTAASWSSADRQWTVEATRADTGIPMGPPGAAPVVLSVQDDERVVRELVPQVVRRTDARDACPDDQDVEVTCVLDLLAAPNRS